MTIWLKKVARLLAVLCSSFMSYVHAEEPLCAEVQISISQEASLERQAFEASMIITNGLDSLSLENVTVELLYEDAEGNSVEVTNDPAPSSALFFERLDDTVGVNAVDGTGSIAPLASAEIRWLIIPTAGAAGQDSNGKLYFVGANLSYTFGGEPQTINVAPDTIVVRPQPLLTLDYFLTQEVVADDAFTLEIEPPQPYTLGVRIKNNGFGTANNIKLESGQPTILENEQGLAIGFSIIGSFINDQPASNSLSVSFGDIEAGQSSIARFIMESTLSGEFTDFSASATHADTLGGELTSLIENTNSSLLVHDVRVDIVGRDGINDFLAVSQEGLRVYESEPANSPIVGCLDCAIVLPLDGAMDNSGSTTGTITRTVTAQATPGFVHIKWDDPFAGQKAVTRVVRDDGKILLPQNYWGSQTRAENNIDFDHFLNIFDVDGAASYTVTFDEFADVPVAPSIAFMPDRTTFEGSEVGFLMQATDANGTIPQLSANNVPAGAAFTLGGATDNIAKGTFTWSPAIGQAGTYAVNFVATDGVLESAQTVTITVNPADDIDGDGLEDAWEELNFGDLSRDGTGDFDGDGLTDLEEFEAGTDPTEANLGIAAAEPLQPYDLEKVSINEPTLVVESIPQGVSADIRYRFEVYGESPDDLVAAGTVLEEGATTSFIIDASTLVNGAVLEENGLYLWRVQAVQFPEGTDYSEWRYSRFVVDAVAEAPVPPALSWPQAGTSVDSLTPTLITNVTSDPEGSEVTYEFALFDNTAWDGLDLDTSSPIAGASSLVENSLGEVMWQVPVNLTDGNDYYWIVTATDESGLSSTSSVGQFTVNTTNHLPASPTINTPQFDEEVTSLGLGDTLDLIIFNSTDADNDPLAYEFELDTSMAFDTPGKVSSGVIPEMAGQSIWQLTGLVENTIYYWRVRSLDPLGTSPWQISSFQVNTLDEPPVLPIIANPASNASTLTTQPLLLAFGDDPDLEPFSFIFTLFDDASQTTQIATEVTPSPVFQLPTPLNNDSDYYWTVQLQDEDGLLGAPTSLQKFSVRDAPGNEPPTINFVKPDSNLTVSGEPVPIQWRDADADSNAIVSLYYSADGGPQMLIESFTEDPDLDSDFYYWDTNGLLPGDYQLILNIEDEDNNVQVVNCCVVTILAPARTISTFVVSGVNLEETGEDIIEVDVVLDVPLATNTQLTLNLGLSDSTEAELVSPLNYLQFDDTNWNIPQRVTIKGADDCDVDGAQNVSLVLSPAVSTDPDYDGVDADDLSFVTLDNEFAGQTLFICDYSLIDQQPATGGLIDYTYQPLLYNTGQSLESASAIVSVAGSELSLVSADSFTFPTAIIGTNTGANENIVVRVDPAIGFDPAKLVWAITPGPLSPTTTGDNNHNTLNGTSGDDVIDGLAGNDTIFGGDGNDLLIGGPGRDTLYGGNGDDTFLVIGTDVHYDNFFGEAGYDRIIGGDGDDTVRVNLFQGAQTVEEIDGGAGINVIEGTNAYNTMDFSNTVLLNIQHIDGLEGNDTITGSQAADVIIGNLGNDFLFGEGGDDIFAVSGANSGFDQVTGGDGVDTVLGTSQDDLIGFIAFTGTTTVEIIDAGAGQDVILGSTLNNTLDFSDTQLIGVELIDGSGGNDTIYGSANDDIIIGNTGNDYILGGLGNDTFIVNGTNQGIDRFSGGDGTDTVLGGPLDDHFQLSVYTASDRVEVIDGNGGVNAVLGNGSSNTLDFSNTTLLSINYIDGLDGNDDITGTAQADTIIGNLGSDRLYGMAGDDVFPVTFGDPGFDTITGGDGIDTILGGVEDDIIGLKNHTGDTIVEVIDGGAGVNRIVGSSSNDTFDFRNTTLINITSLDAGVGSDWLYGTPNDDILIGNHGRDRVFGEAGDDTFIFTHGDPQFNVFNGGEGVDTVLASANDDDISIRFHTGDDTVEVIDGGAGTNRIVSDASNQTLDFRNTTLINIVSLDAGAGSDWLYGTPNNDVIIGNLGRDRLFGEDGDDIFPITYQDPDFDVYSGGNGLDTVVGTANDDDIHIRSHTGSDTVEVIDGGAGINRIVSDSSNQTLDFRNTTLINIVSLDAGVGSDWLYGTPNNDVIIGNLGQDRLFGEAGDDTFPITYQDPNFDVYNGGDGVDTVIGTANDDDIHVRSHSGADTVEIIDGGAGTNRILSDSTNATLDFRNTSLINIESIDAGAGNDWIYGTSVADTIVGNIGRDVYFGDGGDDLFLLNPGDTEFERFNGGDGIDTIQAGDLDDEIRFSVFAGADTVEIIDGGLGVNVILANTSSNAMDFSGTTLLNIDHIDGNAGNDTITGSLGNDTIIGNVGNDTLTGGNGNDLYEFSRGHGVDTISDSGLVTDTDVLSFLGGVASTDLWIVSEGSHIRIYVLGGTDSVRILDWTSTVANQVEEFRTDSLEVLYSSQIQQLIDVMTPIGIPSGGLITLTPAQQTDVDNVRAATWGVN